MEQRSQNIPSVHQPSWGSVSMSTTTAMQNTNKMLSRSIHNSASLRYSTFYCIFLKHFIEVTSSMKITFLGRLAGFHDGCFNQLEVCWRVQCKNFSLSLDLKNTKLKNTAMIKKLLWLGIKNSHVLAFCRKRCWLLVFCALVPVVRRLDFGKRVVVAVINISSV